MAQGKITERGVEALKTAAQRQKKLLWLWVGH
jgi:hypothetical protein